MSDEIVELADRLMLPRRHRQVLVALSEARTFLSRDRLADRVYADDPDGGPLGANDTVCTFVHKLRKVIAPHGFAIITSRHLGYRLQRTDASPSQSTSHERTA